MLERFNIRLLLLMARLAHSTARDADEISYQLDRLGERCHEAAEKLLTEG